MYVVLNTQDVLDIVRAKLVSSAIASNTELILNCIDEVCEAVKIYCNIQNVPADLKYTIANMTIDLMSSMAGKGLITDATLSSVPQDSIASIKDGDSEIKFKASSKSKIDDLVFNYKSQINKFRLLKW